MDRSEIPAGVLRLKARRVARREALIHALLMRKIEATRFDPIVIPGTSFRNPLTIEQVDASIAKAALTAMNVLAAAGFRDPDAPAEPEPAVSPKGPAPKPTPTNAMPDECSSRPITTTRTLDGSVTLFIGHDRTDLTAREASLLQWCLANTDVRRKVGG